ncbi:asparagine synthase-related protein [uncultured Shewanella sp.]|uniref:asparagine synthetase B family protein n=1 Tax=uncultured Shewanella sp. TaxID=173975 RepID=UPI002613F4B2|nr:asparagine synthase-related protein [uncultured Shewanella sp.]
MCGIFISSDPLINPSQIDTIEKTLAFRGPDHQSGLLQFQQWSIYHSRLSIIDLSNKANQPIFDKAGGILLFNGEILNYQELGKKHLQKNYTSDTLLLSGLIINNKLHLDELDGFFSFIYIDLLGQLQYCARDKFGVKPLYFYKRKEYITISSEPSTLALLFNLKPITTAIEEYTILRAPMFNGSFYHHVQQVSPGYCLVKGCYFNPLDQLTGEYQTVTQHELKQALIKGIHSRTVSDAKIGLLLSKGIDSNLIRILSSIDAYYSIGLKNAPDVDYLKTQSIDNIVLYECTPDEYKHNFKQLLKLRHEPMSVPNEVLLAIIAKEAKKNNIKVLLSGEGVDEFFGGYDRIFQWAHTTPVFDIDEFIQLYCYTQPQKSSHTYTLLEEIFKQNHFPSPFEAVRWFFIRYHLPILFRRLDFALMSAGIEGREPLANIHTFNIAAKMAPTQLMGNPLGKMPLRHLMATMKNNSFAFEKKIGFPVNLQTIFKHKQSAYQIWFNENLKVLE